MDTRCRCILVCLRNHGGVVVHADYRARRANQVSEVNRVSCRTTTEIEDAVTGLETQ
jgi:hypothetical protein